MESFLSFLLITAWTVFCYVIAKSIFDAGYPVIGIIVFAVLMTWLFGGRKR